MTAEEGREIAKVEPIPTTLEYLSLAPVRPHDRPDHAQAEAKAALRTALVIAVESIPDPQDLIRRQAHSRVFDADQGLLAPPSAPPRPRVRREDRRQHERPPAAVAFSLVAVNVT